jgi:hypothetical protein
MSLVWYDLFVPERKYIAMSGNREAAFQTDWLSGLKERVGFDRR